MVTVRKSLIMTLVAAAILTTLVFVAIASADTNTPSHRVAGDYTIALPVFFWPPSNQQWCNHDFGHS